ncbi:MAG: cytochrome c biogenesis protein CcsA, partial [bacterium]
MSVPLIGNSFLAVACVMALTSLVGYGGALFGREQWLSLARRAYLVFTIATLATSFWLLKQILDHNFAIAYVHSYSSTDLPLGFLISTFWAGQVGSFLFWLTVLSILGLFLVQRHSERQPTALFFYMLVNCFFLLLLVARSPFAASDPMAVASVPEGMGLNPLLQNYWMVIHPPIVFTGFSLLAVPFSFALAALARNDYRDWVKNVFPLSALGTAVLAAGIFMGGYWAYETLGWGGYWAWDPVENTSLIPWIVN